MFSKILNWIFLTLTITPLIVSIDTYIAQAGWCPRRICYVFDPRGSYSPPTIPVPELARSLAAVRAGRATDVDYLILGHNAFNKNQYSQAKSYYSKANRIAADRENKEVQATAQFGLGEVNNKLGNPNRAVRHLRRSSDIYNDLGDSQSVERVQFRKTQVQLRQIELQPQLELQ